MKEGALISITVPDFRSSQRENTKSSESMKSEKTNHKNPNLFGSKEKKVNNAMCRESKKWHIPFDQHIPYEIGEENCINPESPLRQTGQTPHRMNAM